MENQDIKNTAYYQHKVSDFVSREVYYCASQIVSEIASQKEDFFHLFRKEDYVEAAREDIDNADSESLTDSYDYIVPTARLGDLKVSELKQGLLEQIQDDDNAREYCDYNRIDPHEIDIFEYWIVSDWLADKLAERGEVVEKDFYGLTIWGRACTGQAIMLDSVIQDIYDSVHNS